MAFGGGGQFAGVPFGAASGSVDIGDAEQDGTAVAVPHADHRHAVPAAVGIGTAVTAAGTAAADGNSTAPARANHSHPLGNIAIQIQGAGTLYSGAGAPAAGLGANGDGYLRTDTPGVANQWLYKKSAGAWVGVL